MQARYKKAVMWALYALLMLTVFVIQGVVFGRTRYFGTKLSLLPVALACIAMHAGAENGGVFGCSITDPCLGWEKTERLIYDIAERL